LFSPLVYREVVGSYSTEARKLTLLILDLIGEGLGLESGYFWDELSQVQFMSINHYPRCLDPSLTLGLPKHCDPNLITLVL
jgi:isopenicillin N synthase-like dioxygenase